MMLNDVAKDNENICKDQTVLQQNSIDQFFELINNNYNNKYNIINKIIDNELIIIRKFSKEQTQNILDYASSHNITPETVLQLTIDELAMKLGVQQHYTTLSSILGKKLRGDELSKLQKISDKLSGVYGYPDIRLNDLRAVIRSVLGQVDDRTVEKYYGWICDLARKTAIQRNYSFINIENIANIIFSNNLHHLSMDGKSGEE